MGKLYDNLVRNFENISEEECKEIEHLNKIRPDTVEYVNWINNYKNKLEIKYFELFKKARQEDKEKLITEVCEYLEENIDEDLVIFNNRTWTSRDNLIKDLRKTLEDLK